MTKPRFRTTVAARPPLAGARRLLLGALALACCAGPARAATPPAAPPGAKESTAKPALSKCAPAPVAAPRIAAKPAEDQTSEAKPPVFVPQAVWTEGTVTVGGTRIPYCAVAGTLVVHPKDWDDAAPEPAADKPETDAGRNPTAVASMFHVAYFRRDAEAATRPITFLFNGGPGSASVWLHMGAFGPKRVDTANARHSAPAPYRLVDNDRSLLDVSDLVFIDAPGTGFSRVAGENKDTAFYGVDEDAHAFAAFITAFLSKHRRWNSPKYLFGESYGTTRAAVLVNLLQTDPGVDFNGVVMLSQVLGTQFFPDDPRLSPGNDLPYQLALPTYAATAWYHARAGAPAQTEAQGEALDGSRSGAPSGVQAGGRKATDVPAALMAEVERFAMGDYAAALAAGASLEPAARDAVVAKLRDYTGLSADYLLRSDLRVGVDEFRQELLRERGLIVGASDTRFSGHTLERMGRRAKYDPTDAAIGSAYVSSFNDYVRRVLKYGEDRTYRAAVDGIGEKWSFSHQSPEAQDSAATTNALPDLAHAMKVNPLLRVQLNAGYFDLLTPYFQGRYEMRHLPIPEALRDNIEYRCYPSGHMVYLAPDALARLHDNVADFIERTSNAPARSAHARSGTATGGTGCPPGR